MTRWGTTHAERVLNAVLRSPDQEQAVQAILKALARSWDSGHNAGWRDGVSDATEDNPRKLRQNPYAPRQGTQSEERPESAPTG